MSTQQPNSACLVSVDPSTADILRRQALIILEANHYYFEDILEFGPEAQHALSVIYRDAFAVLDAIGWRRPEPPSAAVDVRLRPGSSTSSASVAMTSHTPTLIACPTYVSPFQRRRFGPSTLTASLLASWTS